ncbi:hypothetical protein OS493_016867 [Desmophyllum pertusum]|uniref:MD-2-related lipid-recognition domain-containing protein n=1 Tax=Desmophyllum pertusum TaxID=174260 RepID=A0A9W9YNV1_9CNID|nr:hypothetical protein OS493_016867 [Desmophyllum pertusum]
MASNTQHRIILLLSVCVMLSTGMKVISLKYCGPPDKTLKWKISPWPVLQSHQPVNVTVTFTPTVDIFESTLQFEVILKEDGQVISRGTEGIDCNIVPQICNLAAGETYTLTHHFSAGLRTVPPGLKGTFIAKAELYNQDQDMWFCVKGEAVL